MNCTEYERIKSLTYNEYVCYLHEKYGTVKGDYFTSGYTQNMAIKRTNEELYIHHIMESKVANLSNVDKARLAPFSYQEASNLVYCNLLEHILLHIMIGEEYYGEDQFHILKGFGGAQRMLQLANDFYGKDNGNSVLSNNEDVLLALKIRCMSAQRVVFQYNQSLVQQIDNTLLRSDRALVVLGTCLGKTTTALGYLRLYGYNAVVLCPNDTVVDGWYEKDPVSGKRLRPLEGVKPITYQSFMNHYAEQDYIKYTVLICDETHHCADSAPRWSEGIHYALNQGFTKVIGLTATPKPDTIRIFHNNICQGYTLLEGIENDIIYDFSYVGAFYDTQYIRDQYKDLEDQTLMGELDLTLNNTPTVENILKTHMPHSKRKGIIFVSDIDAMDEAETIMRNVYPQVEYKRLHSHLTDKQKEDIRNWFKSTDEGYLLAVNMISEGAHYDGVNTLIMFRRTKSAVLFHQQLGRVIANKYKVSQDPEGIVFDLVNNAITVETEEESFLSQLKTIYDAKRKREQSDKMKSDQIIVADYTLPIREVLQKIKEGWSSEHDLFLQNNYHKGASYCATILNKSVEVIRQRAIKLHLTEGQPIINAVLQQPAISKVNTDLGAQPTIQRIKNNNYKHYNIRRISND